MKQNKKPKSALGLTEKTMIMLLMGSSVEVMPIITFCSDLSLLNSRTILIVCVCVCVRARARACALPKHTGR